MPITIIKVVLAVVSILLYQPQSSLQTQQTSLRAKGLLKLLTLAT
jgi:hypothetical protein